MVHLTIDNIELEVSEETTILEAARSVDIYIPTICSHPDLPPYHSLELSKLIYQGNNKFANENSASIESVNECGLCLVKTEGEEELKPSCKTNVKDNMKITTDNNSIRKQRQHNLIRILATHPHSCLTCDQREGCIPLTDVCPGNVPIEERCC